MDVDAGKGNNFTVYKGDVAEDKAKDSREIKVYIQELLPFQSGEFEAAEAKVDVSMPDANVNQHSGNATLTNVQTAIYMDLFSNRAYPPDVVKGEQVAIFKYANSDTLYWFSLGRDDNLRKLEKFRLQVSNTPTSTGKELTDDNTYFLEISTIDGTVS